MVLHVLNWFTFLFIHFNDIHKLFSRVLTSFTRVMTGLIDVWVGLLGGFTRFYMCLTGLHCRCIHYNDVHTF